MSRLCRKAFFLLLFSIIIGTGCANSQEKRTLAFESSGDPDSGIRVIFIHGSPGSKEAYEAYLQNPALNEVAELISVDRLGFGESRSQVETSLVNQAESIAPFLSDSQKNILVGHSLGSPIALQLALLAPDRVQGMMLIASAFDPELEHPKWYNQLADTIIAKWILSTGMNNSNEEMIVLSDELTLLAGQDWNTITMPVVILHGSEDSLAEFGNAEFAYRKLNPATASLKVLEGEGHLVIWQNEELITEEILHFVTKIQGRVELNK